MTAQKLPVAAVQFEPTLAKKSENIETLLALTEQAAREGARLIVLPEMATTGYCWYHREEVAPYVETMPGPTTEAFTALAARHDCYIVVGMPERDPATDLYYNSAVLLGPQGVVGVHRKTHPYIAEPKWAANGDRHAVFDTPIGRIGLLVCMDIHFVETARLMALNGAQVICHLSNWLDERTPAPYWLTRAWENDCALIEGNRWGWERGVKFSGGSCVVGADGTLLGYRDDGDGVVHGDIELPERNRSLAKRRPELYHRLLTNTFSWNPKDFFGLYGFRPLPPGKRSVVAAGQFTPGASLNGNLEALRDMALRARDGGAELLVFPERALTGPGGRETAIEAGDEALKEVLDIAMEANLNLVVGWLERDGERYYNSARLLGPAGVLADYRQIHIAEPDRHWLSAGDRWVCHDLPCGRVGLLLGEDLTVPEAGRVLSLEGCDIIAAPASLHGPVPMAHGGSRIAQNYPIPTGEDPHHWLLPRVRAGENNLWVVFANNAGDGAFGLSGVYGPDTFAFPRSEVKQVRARGVVMMTIDTGDDQAPYPTHVVRRKDLVLMRQPHHYQPLVERDTTQE